VRSVCLYCVVSRVLYDSDRPGNTADVYHTFFGIAGMTLLGFFKDGGPLPHQEVRRRGVPSVSLS
jgi:hypothetical protein